MVTYRLIISLWLLENNNGELILVVEELSDIQFLLQTDLNCLSDNDITAKHISFAESVYCKITLKHLLGKVIGKLYVLFA